MSDGNQSIGNLHHGSSEREIMMITDDQVS